MREHFDHTADLGLRVTAADLNELFAEAGRSLFEMVVEDLEAVRPNQALAVAVPGTDREYLMFDWLRELLRHSDQERTLFSKFEVSVADDGLTATVWGELLDPARHALLREVKAITYHGLKVERTADGWLAEVIVDI